MIARIWHGKTKKSDFEAYTELTKRLAIPDYSNTPGFKGLTFLRMISGDEAHFKLITYWDNMEVIKNFAGEDVEKAKYYPDDDAYLLEFEDKVQHYEVFASSVLSS
jgi:heme-degrading monooxygenase HmoA